jgi:hypothetical protein
MGLGSYTTVSLAEAWDAARKAHQAIRDGRDPIAERKAAKEALKAEQDKRMTFEEAARKYHKDVKTPALRSEKSRADWIKCLDHAFPLMGNLQVGQVELPHVLAALEPLWPRPVATYFRAAIEDVLEWAAVRGYRQKGDNPAA